MADPFAPVRPGQPFEPRADWQNAVSEVVRAGLRGRQLGGQLPVPAGLPNPALIRLKNTTGADVPQFGVLKVGVPLFLPSTSLDQFKRDIVYEGLVAQPMEPYGVLLEPLGPNRIGWAVIQGVAIAKCAFTHDKMPFADGDGIATELEGSGDGYAKVLWKESGTGSGKWAVLLLGAGPRGYFPVTLTQTGGSNGNKTTPASWTYTVTAPGWDGASAQLGTAIAPAITRENGTRVAATMGQAYYASASLILWTHNERPGTGSC